MTKQALARPARWGAGVLAVGGAVLLGACGSTGTGTSTTSQPATPAPSSPATSSASPATSSASPATSLSAATCQHVTSLRMSVEDLTHISLNASASSQIRKDLTNIQAQLTALKSENTGALSPQLTQLSTSLQQVQKAAQGLSGNPSASQISAIITALAGLKGQASGTLTQLKAACP